MDDDSEMADNIDGDDDDLEPGSQSVLPFNFFRTPSILFRSSCIYNQHKVLLKYKLSSSS